MTVGIEWPEGVDSLKVLLCSDHQIPFHDKGLHKAACTFIGKYWPDIIVVLGDFIDLPSISRFSDPPDPTANIRNTIKVARSVLDDYLFALPVIQRKPTLYYLPGNHEQRFPNYILKNAPELQGELSIPELLKLDLWDGVIQWVLGDWPQSQLQLTPKLTATHGWIVRKSSGASALATLEHLSRSVIVGHTHRMGMVFRTQHGPRNKVSIHTGVEIGTMCTISGGLGYAVEPNWQNGFCTLTIYRDGTFSTPRLISYSNGRLYE